MGFKKYLGSLLYEVFHENTKKTSLTEHKEYEQRVPESWEEIHYKSYDTSIKTKLDQNFEKKLFTERSSATSFQKYKIKKKELSLLLKNSAGIRGKENNQKRRVYPSAGAKYPLEVYVNILNAKNLETGLYHYNVKQNELEKIKSMKKPKEEFLSVEGFEEVSLILYITAIPERTVKKYGNRGYRNILLEAGHMMQNFCLYSEKIDLSCRPYNNFVEDGLSNFLELGDKEIVVYSGLIGKPI